jgi:hypothetical protein
MKGLSMDLKHISAAVALLSALHVSAPAQTQPVGGTPQDTVFYVGGAGRTRLAAAFALADGTLLAGGGATSLEWLPAGTPVTALAGAVPPGGGGEFTPFLLRLSPDARRILGLLTLPRGCAEDIVAIRATSMPGEPTGVIHIAGRVADGYFIARLDGNFVTRPVTRLLWSHHVRAAVGIRANPPWDVDAQGRVIFAAGEPHGYNWVAVEALDADGRPAVVPKWRRHWVVRADGGKEEFAGWAADAPGRVEHSAIVLKVWGRGDFRSWTREDYLAKVPDGNGGFNQGRWPFDGMFGGYFDPATGKDVQVTADNRGWYGYRWGNTPCANVGAIAIDRRTGAMYIGGNNKSRLPGGNPDFEPWIAAMDRDGALLWWMRLYPESKGVSTPDQYVDALAIDYSVPLDRQGALVVAARAHGNNVNNFWQGHRILHPANPRRAFQPQFTGRQGNIHYSWIGRMTLTDGTMLHATYMGEYGEGAKHGGRRFAEPLLSHWPDISDGWPDLNTTRLRALAVDPRGRPVVAARGRRVITTRNAFQHMPSPTEDPGKTGVWSDFVRFYRQDLTTLDYSSLLTGAWDWDSGKGGSEIELAAVLPLADGVLAVGHAPLGKSGVPEGNDMPARNVPPWGRAGRLGEMGVLARLRLVN